ncbi:unnamed protein product [Cyprideis torosa]|uniref:Uncharacterized protein n=1 Tax=Cyprideis torosa TaxID=163714 RepID=A0A7R8WS02_9CRUS|nr:unnamed protein product [Cyprideis torosa]CAG0904321.1 unnamed protein product [Cyprideis torosa]
MLPDSVEAAKRTRTVEEAKESLVVLSPGMSLVAVPMRKPRNPGKPQMFRLYLASSKDVPKNSEVYAATRKKLWISVEMIAGSELQNA